MADTKAHWDAIYATKEVTQVSWYQPHATHSLRSIQRHAPDRETPILDVGSGATALVGDLLQAGYRRLTVLDVSATAVGIAQQRLAERAAGVTWLVADVTTVALPAASVSAWHDRAVFHFLADADDRRRYLDILRDAVAPGGVVIMATFAPDGPTQCSGLDVVRYDPQDLHAVLGPGFELLETADETHRTPGGGEQKFIYVCSRKAR